MTESVSELVAALGPLQSSQARLLMYVLAHKADEAGNCGIIPLKELSRLSQLSLSTVTSLLNDLEDRYGLVRKIERGPSEPSEFRVRLDRLASPHAHLKQDVTTFKAVFGPVAGQQFPVSTLPDQERVVVVSNTTGKLSVPLVYRKTHSTLLPMMMAQEIDGVGHVYRLSTRTWRYVGTSVETLMAHGASRSTVKRLKDADVLTMEELSHKYDTWIKYRGGTPDNPSAFGPALLKMSVARQYVAMDDVAPLGEAGARTVLAGLRTWDEDGERRSTSGPSGDGLGVS
jgi:DNA-binding MarR family transcriptional regulator